MIFAFRLAGPDDAGAIARIISATSEGVVAHLFDGLIPGLSSDTILSAALMKGERPYCTGNIIISEKDEELTSLLFSYPSCEHAVPALMESFIPKRRLTAVRPVLERCLPDSLFINTFWIRDDLRGSGYADALMVEAESKCRSLGFSRINLFCWNDNARALRFYARHKFAIVEHIPPEQLPLEGHPAGGALLAKTIDED